MPNMDGSFEGTPSLLDWSIEQVAGWLTDKGYGQYVPLLCDQHKLDGVGLLLLQEDDLKSAPMSMQIIGDVKRLTYDLKKLKKLHGHQSPRQHNTPVFRPRSFVKRTASFGNFLDNTRLGSRDTIVLPADFFKQEPVRLEPELTKLFVALAYLVVVSWILAVVMVIVNERVPDMKKYPPLPDIFLDNIPLYPVAFQISEYCGTLLMVIWAIVCLFHKHRTILLRRFFALLGTAYLLRSVTVLITSLSVPGTHINCPPKSLEALSLVQRFEEAFIIWKGAGLSIRGVNTCGDYLFSGHTTALTFLNFFITEYTPNTQAFYALHLFAWIINILALGCILASHEHYSIDVFIAFYLTSRLFLYYHSMANNQALYQKDARRVRIWFPLFGYLESAMTCRVPNEYQSLGEIVEYVCVQTNETLKFVKASLIG